MKMFARLFAVGAVLFFAAGQGLASSKPTTYAHLLGYLPSADAPEHVLVLAEIPANVCAITGTPRVLEIETGVQVKVPLIKVKCTTVAATSEARPVTVDVILKAPLGERYVIDDQKAQLPAP